MSKNLVFCYGTLKKGYRLNHYLRNAKFVGSATTLDQFDMIDVGFPVILPPENYGYIVQGEVYDVSDDTLKILDQIENEGYLYQRQTRTVWLSAEAKFIHVDIYIGIMHRWEDQGLRVDLERGNTRYNWTGSNQRQRSTSDA